MAFRCLYQLLMKESMKETRVDRTCLINGCVNLSEAEHWGQQQDKRRWQQVTSLMLWEYLEVWLQKELRHQFLINVVVLERRSQDSLSLSLSLERTANFAYFVFKTRARESSVTSRLYYVFGRAINTPLSLNWTFLKSSIEDLKAPDIFSWLRTHWHRKSSRRDLVWPQARYSNTSLLPSTRQ